MKELLVYIRKMFEIIAYVHDHNIVMRNLTLDSFQFDTDDEDGGVLHLVNYENSKAIYNDETLRYGHIKGKVVYQSPEIAKIIKGRQFNKKSWNKDISGKMYMASDIWALGVITYYLVTGTVCYISIISNTYIANCCELHIYAHPQNETCTQSLF